MLPGDCERRSYSPASPRVLSALSLANWGWWRCRGGSLPHLGFPLRFSVLLLTERTQPPVGLWVFRGTKRGLSPFVRFFLPCFRDLVCFLPFLFFSSHFISCILFIYTLNLFVCICILFISICFNLSVRAYFIYFWFNHFKCIYFNLSLNVFFLFLSHFLLCEDLLAHLRIEILSF